jgi:DnaK suppressor protein
MSSVVRKAGRTSGEAAHYERLRTLRREQLQVFEVRLRDLRASLTPTESVEVNDLEALADSCSSAGIGAAIIEITSRTLQGIEGALQRVQSGEYGVCAECGAEISAARLRAVPFAERCRDCQELADGQLVLAA